MIFVAAESFSFYLSFLFVFARYFNFNENTIEISIWNFDNIVSHEYFAEINIHCYCMTI